jgi:hypothetical protein
VNFDRFGRRTRRGLASIASGLVPLLGLAQLDDADARRRRRKNKKKRRRRRKCRQLEATCTPGGKRKCCQGLRCDQTVVADVVGTFCCEPEGAPCESAETCCSRSCDFLVEGGTCAPCRGRSCSSTQPCCGGLDCTGGFCGGCRGRAVVCASSDQCCFSDCVSNACLSAAGGPCAQDADCSACYLSHNCEGACVGGVCTA